MTNLSPVFCQRVRACRKEAGISQSELAAELGCKQSAISMFESGDGTKLSDKAIEALAKKFKLEIEHVGEPASRVVSAVRAVPASGFCPNAQCPSNEHYEVEGHLYHKPNRALADPVGGRFCAICGEVLERRCSECGSPVHDGAVCSFCGKAYVAG